MIIKSEQNKFKTKVNLPGSKSIANRVLMIRAYSELDFPIGDLSEADDTQMLVRNLDLIRNCSDSSIPMVIDCGNAGTVFRFLLTFLASTPGQWMLTGSIRMKSRPVGDLVESLKSIGADIQYAENKLFPPVKITGKRLLGGKTSVSMEKSSQFASSLILAAPTWKNGIVLELTDNLSSEPYLDMTIKLMEQFGAKINRYGRMVVVLPLTYQEIKIDVESDWSAASYWYEMVALSEGSELLLKKLQLKSLQGDSVMVCLFSALGVETFQEPDGILIFNTGKIAENLSFDLSNYPDLLPALVATCCGLGKSAVFSGLENLKYKESDRTLALKEQMAKLDYEFIEISEGVFKLFPSEKVAVTLNEILVFDTYADHRMAMAFAPLALKLGTIQIQNPHVVEKSYPNFWDELFATNAIVQIHK